MPDQIKPKGALEPREAARLEEANLEEQRPSPPKPPPEREPQGGQGEPKKQG
jgi:hypothetical protein